jgi:putative DNA primase/helicase
MNHATCIACGDTHLCPQGVKAGPLHWHIMADFIDECCQTGTDRSIRAANLYDAYRLWAMHTEQATLSFNAFSRGMKHNGHKAIKQSVMWYYGISLTDEHFKATWPNGLHN